MKRKRRKPVIAAPPKPRSIRARYVAHLESENEWLRREYSFFKGKCERLELAMMTANRESTAAQQYVDRSDKQTDIAKAKVEVPNLGSEKSWAQTQATWANMTPEEQQKRIDAAFEGKPL